jgi:choline-sulfatase
MRRLKALYYGQITHVDDAIGKILVELERLGLADNTVIFFMSDHGEMMGDHGLSQKNCPYEASIRIPLLLRWPGRTAAGSVCKDPVDLTDILPTLIEELDLPYFNPHSGPLPGASLLGKDGGGLRDTREFSFSDYHCGKDRWIAARSDRYKYALHAADGGREELFDLYDDPNETRNLVAENPELASQMRDRVLAWEKQYGLSESFDNGHFSTFPRPQQVPTEDTCRRVHTNESPAPKRLPADEQDRLETFAEAFTNAIAKEDTLSPEKLSLSMYKAMLGKKDPDKTGSESLVGTPWEEAFLKA